MDAAEKAKSIAWQIAYHAKSMAEQGALLGAMAVALGEAERAASEDVFAGVNFDKPIPALTPMRPALVKLDLPGVEKMVEYAAPILAAMTDEQVAAADALLAAALAEQVKVEAHNTLVWKRWRGMLDAHGAQDGGRINIKERAISGIREKFLAARYGETTVGQALAQAQRAAGASGDCKTVAGIRDAARATVARQTEERRAKDAAARGVSEQTRRAEEQARKAEESRRETERENARLRTQLSQTIAPTKPTTQPIAVPSDPNARVKNLELE